MRVALVVGFCVVGCGDSGDNDNGISFRAVGFFQGTFQDDRCQVPTADEAIADQSNNLVLDSALVDSGYPAGAFFCRAYLWLENNLRNQAVVVDRLDFEYEIPGSRSAFLLTLLLLAFVSILPVRIRRRRLVHSVRRMCTLAFLRRRSCRRVWCCFYGKTDKRFHSFRIR